VVIVVKSAKANAPAPMASRLTPEAFVLQAIATLKTEKYKGVHVVHSKFNQAFREYFGDEVDPIDITTQMRKDGKIAVFLKKGGASLYLRLDLMAKTLERHDAEWAVRDAEGFQKPAKKPAMERSDVLEKILKGS
jgi:hypothetical protein